MRREVKTLRAEVDERLRAFKEREERGADPFAPPDAGPLQTIDETAEEAISLSPRAAEAEGTSRPRKSRTTTLNTATFGMYAVACAVHPTTRTNRRVRMWCTRVGVLCLVFMQLIDFLHY